MIFDRIKEAGMKAAMSPSAMKLLSDPRVQKMMMRALRLPSDVRMAMEKNGQTLAKSFALVTREELSNMKRNLRDLKSQIDQLENELEKARSAPAAAPVSPSNGSSAPKTAAKPKASAKKSVKVTRKKKVTVTRKTTK